MTTINADQTSPTTPPKSSPEPDPTFHYLCIGCPMGCRLEVEEDIDHHIVEVRGFTCKRGEQYARQEHVQPTRTVTTTVAIINGQWARLPVKTADPIPKPLIMDLCAALHQLQIPAPITLGQVILPNALGTGVDVVASRSMAQRP
jgi:CxxC motif-containing protein